MSALLIAAVAAAVGVFIAWRFPQATESALRKIVLSWRLIGAVFGAILLFYALMSGAAHLVLGSAIVIALIAAYLTRRRQEGDWTDALSR